METENKTGMLTVVERRGEVASTAMAAKVKAEVEARYVIALRPENRRVHMQVRASILEACKRKAFAEGAIYRKPMGGGGKTVDGFSIRFAEEAIRAMKNIVTDSTVIWEDDEKRTIHVSVTDLESNTVYGDDITVAKTVERKFLKDGQEAISSRKNSNGETTYLVAATEDDMANKIASAKSKIIRNNGLRLVPSDILDEAWDAILETMRKGGGDPKAEIKKICDAFVGIGVKPEELERLLGHSLESVSPSEIVDLRKTFSAIKEGEATWKDFIAQADPKKPVAATEEKPVEKEVKIDKPYEAVVALCQKEGVTEGQVLAFAKTRKMCNPVCEELAQVSDAKLASIAKSWPNIVNDIKVITLSP